MKFLEKIFTLKLHENESNKYDIENKKNIQTIESEKGVKGKRIKKTINRNTFFVYCCIIVNN